MLSLIANMMRTHLPKRGAFILAMVLMVALELSTYVFLIWYFFLRDTFPVPPLSLIVAGGIYTLLALAFLLVNFTGRMLCFKVLGFFYLAVAIFFPLKGLMYLQERDFNPWGFYLLWIALIIVSFREIALELGARSDTAD
jgi:hypothetical protein